MATARRTKRRMEPAREPHPQSRVARPELHEVPPQPEQPLRDDMLLNYEEVAARIRKTPFQVARIIYNGELPVTRIGRTGLVSGEDLREFIEQHARPTSKRRR